MVLYVFRDGEWYCVFFIGIKVSFLQIDIFEKLFIYICLKNVEEEDYELI